MVLIMLLSRFSLALLQTKKGMPLIIADYGYSHADWDQLQDKQAPWEDIFKLSASTAAKIIAHKIDLFCLYKQASYPWKRVLEDAKLSNANKTRVYHFQQT